MKRESVLKQLAELQTMDITKLKDKWRALYGTEPPKYNRPFLVKRLAYRIQELAYGGLSDSAKEKMRTILKKHGYDDKAAKAKKTKKSKNTVNMPVAGTVLSREWKGVKHQVIVAHDGFIYEGVPYRSLSAIAKLITGTHWNGLLFFGLREKKAK